MTGISDSSGMTVASRRWQARIAARELEMMQQRGQAFEAERQRDADDDLVQPEAHAEQRHDQRHRDAAGRAVRKPSQSDPE